jgi:uncharacterized membrane protein (UPF0127 family)
VAQIDSFRFLFLADCIFVQGDTLHTTTVIVTPQVRLEVELAYNNETRASGLMFRKSLPEDGGMLFLFADLDYHSFWMKNTLISLDMIWLNERMEIVYFLTAEPCRKDPCSSLPSFQKAQYV